MVTMADPSAPATCGSDPAALRPGQRPEFATACADARHGFQDVIDLLLVADDVGQRDPGRRVETLNRLAAVRAVGVWERFVRDVGALCRAQPADGDLGRLACLRAPGGEAGAARLILSVASGGALPDAWRVHFPAPERAADLTFVPVAGTADELAAAVDWWVRTRHGAPHRRSPRDLGWPVRTAAHDTDGRFVDATTARFTVALFLQLVDQSIRVIAGRSGMARAQDLWLPEQWLHGRDDDGARLWDGEPVAPDPAG